MMKCLLHHTQEKYFLVLCRDEQMIVNEGTIRNNNKHSKREFLLFS